jgi:JmjC domain
MYVPTFAELAGPEEEFFSACFGQAPLYRPGALERDPRQLLSIADMDEILHCEAIRPPHFGVTSNGGPLLPPAYTATTRVQGANVTDTVVPERVYELFRTGATLIWTSINHFRPNLRALSRMLAEKFAAESGVTAFLTPAGRKGINPHHDPGDTFVIQLEGTKHWKLWKPPAVRRGDFQAHKLEELGEPVLEVSLRPGDVLYLPWGTPHVAAAEDQISLHLSVMVRTRLWSDLLRRCVDRLLEDPRFWEFPYLNETTVDLQAGPFADQADLLARRLEEMDLAAEVRRLIADGQRSPGSSQGSTFQEIAAIDAINPATRLHRTGLEVSFLETAGGKTKTKVNGHTIAIPEPVAARLRELGDRSQIAARELFPSAGEQRSASAAQALARLGILAVTEGAP